MFGWIVIVYEALFNHSHAQRTERLVHIVFPTLRGSGQRHGIIPRTRVFDCWGGKHPGKSQTSKRTCNSPQTESLELNPRPDRTTAYFTSHYSPLWTCGLSVFHWGRSEKKKVPSRHAGPSNGTFLMCPHVLTPFTFYWQWNQWDKLTVSRSPFQCLQENPCKTVSFFQSCLKSLHLVALSCFLNSFSCCLAFCARWLITHTMIWNSFHWVKIEIIKFNI